jgi:hypothetical protein
VTTNLSSTEQAQIQSYLVNIQTAVQNTIIQSTGTGGNTTTTTSTTTTTTTTTTTQPVNPTTVSPSS